MCVCVCSIENEVKIERAKECVCVCAHAFVVEGLDRTAVHGVHRVPHPQPPTLRRRALREKNERLRMREREGESGRER